jgi:DNA-binding NtrC family response regulator
MPEGMTGRDLAEQLRAQKPGLRVIFVSGYSADVMGKGTEFLRRTKSYFPQKPYATSKLLQTVRECPDKKLVAPFLSLADPATELRARHPCCRCPRHFLSGPGKATRSERVLPFSVMRGSV